MDNNQKMKTKKSLSLIFIISLLVVFMGMFAAFFIILWSSQTYNSKKSSEKTLAISLKGTTADITDTSDFNMAILTKNITNVISLEANPNNEYLDGLLIDYNVAEINIINNKGIIIASTVRSFINYNMTSGEQSNEFMAIINDNLEYYVQPYQNISIDTNTFRKYAAYKYNGGFVQIGYNADQFQDVLKDEIESFTKNDYIGETGYIIIINKDNKIISNQNDKDLNSNINVASISIDEINSFENNKMYTTKIYGEDAYVMKSETEGYTILAAMPAKEVLRQRNISMLIAGIIEGVIFIVLGVLVYFMIKKIVVKSIISVNDGLAKITSGDLETVINVRNTKEFNNLSNDINSTVDTLKVFIKDAEEKNAKELEFAKKIQSSALPSVFPAFPNIHSIDIYAGMKTAKEVGGDFYDFYFVSKDTIAFLVADVSGKGIPAAMFMMEAKTIIKSYAETGMPVNEVLTNANNRLCENNEAGMFVTCWIGAINLTNGHLTYANAGHNMPLLKTGKNKFTYLKGKRKMPLGTWEGLEYELNEIDLGIGDRIYLYTDGVTEATNSDEKLYGDEKLANLLNSEGTQYLNCRELCDLVFNDVDIFQDEADQFDDITMLSLQFNSYLTNEVAKELQLSATLKNISIVTEFVETELTKLNCPKKALAQINIAIDELFSALAKNNESETARVKLQITNEPLAVHITFTEQGKAYNPLEKKATNIGINSTDEDIDALGLLFVKKSMDEITYEYKNGENILKIKKNL